MKALLWIGVALFVVGMVCTNLARTPPSAYAGMYTAGLGAALALLAGLWFWLR